MFSCELVRGRIGLGIVRGRIGLSYLNRGDSGELVSEGENRVKLPEQRC